MDSEAAKHSSAAQRRLLLTRGTVIAMDDERQVIPDGAVLVEGERIAAVGIAADLEREHESVERIDVAGGVILPGLINTHTHLFQGLLKGLGDDRPLNRWLAEMTAPAAAELTEEDCEAAALNGAVEAIRSGCTTVVDFMYAHPRPRLADAVIRGLEQAGIRALVARGFITRGTEFGVPPALVETIDEALADCERLVRRHGGDASLLRIGVAPCLLWMISEDDLRATRAFADQFRAPITYHLAETSFETSYAERTYRMPETDVLSRAGLLGPDLLAAHCTKLSRRDIRMLRNFDVKVSHNPISNMYLGAGIAPVEEMVSAGISVGLATDGPASNNNQNMVQVLKAAALLHKVAAEDATAMTAEKVLEMATIDGARCIGLEREIGSIEPGKRADIAVFSLSNPFIAPVHDPVSALVYAATGSEAVTVLVDGRVVMRDGSLTLLDERVVMDRAAAAAHGLAQRAGIGGPRRPWRSRGH